MKRPYRFLRPALAVYGQRPSCPAVEQIQWPSKEFCSDREANRYAKRVFGSRAFALRVLLLVILLASGCGHLPPVQEPAEPPFTMFDQIQLFNDCNRRH
jgi:hypothetical protein